MPELPEILNLSEQMDKELRGKIIKSIRVVQEKCLNMPSDDFTRLLLDKRIEQVTCRGKWIFVELEQGTWLLLNLGMGGNVILHGGDNALPEKCQLRIDFDDGRVLTISFSWFGYVHAVSDGDLAGHSMTAKLGMTPVRDSGFTQEYFFSLLAGRRGSVKGFLLNQHNIAGIGNVYIQDILFRARMHPDQKLQTLTDIQKLALYRGILETLEESARLGGLAYEKDLYNKPGGFRDFLVGYREGQLCPVCGTTIQKIKTGSTSSYICPNCQCWDDGKS
ncbi:MAG TPA: Fpg/Nei family DNA glycosylase [Dehalococcoidia bacterium]|nr:Fpg/Nei family DNA glycosylase [Dehalococcoidia bacterium]